MVPTRWLRLVTLLAAIALVATACGGDDGGGSGGGGDDDGGGEEITIIHGTTDPPSSYDPSGSYDLPSWTIIYNVFEGLLTIEPGGNEPLPSLAESCQYDDPQTYTCTLKQGVTFHDGTDLTASDVKFSIDRNIMIHDEASGGYTLLGGLATPDTFTGEEVEVVDDYTVTFHLPAPDATWPKILSTPAAYIVSEEAYTDTALQEDTPGQVVGTGPYELVGYESGVQTVLEAFDGYHGEAPANDRVIVQLFDESSALKLAVEQGDVDIAYRNLTPTDIADLEGADGVSVVEGNGTEIRYLVFNVAQEPFDELAVRQAIALTLDRQAIADNAYNGTVDPLYSQVPVGLAGHVPAWEEEYGAAPDPDAAAALLSDAGVETPLDITVWYTPTRYGDTSADEYAEIERSLEDSGLFNVELDSTEWEQYKEAAFGSENAAQNQYGAFQLGWFPDYVDADNYTSPFFSANGGFLHNGYENPVVSELLTQQKASTDEAERTAIFEEIQRLVAAEAPVIPYYQAKQVAVVREGVTGVEETFDPSFQFRFWLISKS